MKRKKKLQIVWTIITIIIAGTFILLPIASAFFGSSYGY